MLTPAEHQALEHTALLSNLMPEIVGEGATRDADLRELIAHVHVIQHAILAQAAGRAYPDKYRLLGETLS